MNYHKIFTLITPLTLVAAMALVLIVTGLVESKDGGHENYSAILAFIGLFILIISLLLHFGIRWWVRKNAKKIWIAEAILVLIAGLFLYLK